MKTPRLTATTLALAGLTATGALARDNIQIAGSSTVLPYASIVAEYFGENFDYRTPVVESGGSSAGLKRFCEGVGDNTIDIANASRAIRDSEFAVCAANGVTGIIEVRIGYDGIVFASGVRSRQFDFTPADIYAALAARRVVDGALSANTATSWAEIDPALPDQPIRMFIPGTKHGTREVFEEKVILQGCTDSGAMAAILALNGGDADAAKATCTALRTDGRSVDIDGDYTETLARIESDANGVGVFGLSFYESNTDRLQVATMSGVVPSIASISTGAYPVSRPLYFYIKAAHLDTIPGLADYAAFFLSDEVAGPGGPLAEYGLVPDPELAATQAAVAARVLMGH